MRLKDLKLVDEVKGLMEEVSICEATSIVWKKFMAALDSLEPNSVYILQRYFSGISLEQLQKEENLSKKELQTLIHRARRDLIEKLRRNCQVRQ